MPGTNRAKSRDLTPTGGCGSRRLPVAGIRLRPVIASAVFRSHGAEESMSTLRCGVPELQPATRFKDRNWPSEMWFRFKPRHLCMTRCCRRLRWAKYLRIQVYCDGLYFWCSDGHGCQSLRRV